MGKFKQRRVFKLGITGSFGSGKSTVAKRFASWGGRHIDCDRIAHEALKKKSPVYARIRRQFAFAVNRRTGAIDRTLLAAHVFGNTSARRKLERIIHPYVRKRVGAMLQTMQAPVAVIEVPLLFEAGWDRWMDRTVTVSVSRARIKARLKRSRKLPARVVDLRLRAQMPLHVKRRKSDFVIDNNGSIRRTIAQARTVWRSIKIKPRER